MEQRQAVIDNLRSAPEPRAGVARSLLVYLPLGLVLGSVAWVLIDAIVSMVR